MPSSGLRVQRRQCTTFPPQLLLLASKTARRSATSAARCATARRLSSGVALVSPRGCRTKGLPMAKCLCHPTRPCARRAHSVNTGSEGRGMNWTTLKSLAYFASFGPSYCGISVTRAARGIFKAAKYGYGCAVKSTVTNPTNPGDQHEREAKRDVPPKPVCYRGDSNLARVQLNINSKALVAHIDRAV